jgi:hypothetical protein
MIRPHLNGSFGERNSPWKVDVYEAFGCSTIDMVRWKMDAIKSGTDMEMPIHRPRGGGTCNSLIGKSTIEKVVCSELANMLIGEGGVRGSIIGIGGSIGGHDVPHTSKQAKA